MNTALFIPRTGNDCLRILVRKTSYRIVQNRIRLLINYANDRFASTLQSSLLITSVDSDKKYPIENHNGYKRFSTRTIKSGTISTDNSNINNVQDKTVPFLHDVAIFPYKEEGILSRIKSADSDDLACINSDKRNETSGGDMYNIGIDTVSQESQKDVVMTLGDQLAISFRAAVKRESIRIPKSSWIFLENVSALNSLDNVLTAVNTTLANEQNSMGILDIDAIWSAGQPLPFLDPVSIAESNAPSESLVNDNQKVLESTQGVGFVQRALFTVSAFGRPNGWYLKLRNRSMVYSLLGRLYNSTTKRVTLRCAWKYVPVHEYTGALDPFTNAPMSTERCIVPFDAITDRTVRIENCPDGLTEAILFNYFSRYDLAPPAIPQPNTVVPLSNDVKHLQHKRATTPLVLSCGRVVQKWVGMTPEGKVSSTPTFLVHFADPSWARAAIREKQSSTLRLNENQPIRMIQYPKQIF